MQKVLMDNKVVANGRSVEYRVDQTYETLVAFDKVYTKHRYQNKR